MVYLLFRPDFREILCPRLVLGLEDLRQRTRPRNRPWIEDKAFEPEDRTRPHILSSRNTSLIILHHTCTYNVLLFKGEASPSIFCRLCEWRMILET